MHCIVTELIQIIYFGKSIGVALLVVFTLLYCNVVGFRNLPTKMVKTRVNRFTRVLQFSGNNYFLLKNRIFLQKRERDRFSAGVSGLARRPGLCRSALYVIVGTLT